MPDRVQPQRLPFVDAPPAPPKNYPADNTNSPPHTRPGLKVQTSKVLSRAHQNHLRPQHQWESQDLFARTVEK